MVLQIHNESSPTKRETEKLIIFPLGVNSDRLQYFIGWVFAVIDILVSNRIQ